jgi:hypothetical protein
VALGRELATLLDLGAGTGVLREPLADHRIELLHAEQRIAVDLHVDQG